MPADPLSRLLLALIIAAVCGSVPAATFARDDILLADFEGETYGDWKTTGEAFGKGPARGTLAGQMPVSGFKGKGLVNSFLNGDGTTGTLTSPAFRIERKYLNFLIGGGNHPGETCINLLVDGKVVRTASGPNDRPGGSEQLDWRTWDVAEFAGREAVLEIIDKHTGGWGHINIDQIVQSDRRLQAEPARREVTIGKRYLHLPVKTGAPQRRVRFVVDGKTVREFEIELADAKPDFLAFSDVGALRGKKLAIEVAALPGDSQALTEIVQSDETPAAGELYREAHRPQFHFTSRRGWLNDPNGLVYSGGEYHLFYQHNPFGWNWGNMHWGHAVSKDLIHWTELPIALYPRAFGDWAFSGSAVVDSANSAGFKTGADDVLVAAYTSTGRGECIVFSNDRGQTWTEYAGNPAVKHAGRDPRLLWHAPTKKWVMAVYDEHEGKRWIAFYTSGDLKSWQFASRIEGFYECPDLFELPVEGTNASKWVLYAADGKYMVGQFDGREFHPESEKQQLWYGNFYAAQTYSNAPGGRRIQIGWGNGITFPGMSFNQQMTIPCELTLKNTAEGVRMFARPDPLKGLVSQRGLLVENAPLAAGNSSKLRADADLWDLDFEFQPDADAALTLDVRGVPIVYDAKKRELSCRQVIAPVPPVDGNVRLRILVDRGSVEIFANDGCVAMSIAAIPPDGSPFIEVTVKQGSARVTRLTGAMLESTWPEPK